MAHPELRLVVDLAAERGLDYYTGISFQGLAEGVGRPLLSGGRYDGLLGRYGCDLPAVGFAIDEQAVLEALVLRGIAPELPPRDVLVVGDGAEASALTTTLRGLDEPTSIVRSISPSSWRDLDDDALATRLQERGFRLAVFVDAEALFLVVAEHGRRVPATLDDVLDRARCS